MVKLYTNESWLRRRYVHKQMTAKQIADEAGVSEMTIDRYLDRYNLKRNRRRNL